MRLPCILINILLVPQILKTSDVPIRWCSHAFGQQQAMSAAHPCLHSGSVLSDAPFPPGDSILYESVPRTVRRPSLI
eukprot:5502965-Pyramimonas_sp.AAC.1